LDEGPATNCGLNLAGQGQAREARTCPLLARSARRPTAAASAASSLTPSLERPLRELREWLTQQECAKPWGGRSAAS